ncbi:MAG: endonuclease/exonuclease/phosphatase family protein [Verrucomicrobiales bacterium]|nr:endonuclease/exonuclease/phosphatase family protein [Verrucomicrobiales bacterium]
MAAVAKLLGDLSSEHVMDDLGMPTNEKEIVIAGDLNDSSHKKSGFRYIFDYFEGVDYTHLGPSPYPRTRTNRGGSEIDHIFVSESLMESGAVDENTFKVWGVENTPEKNKEYRDDYSDHFPLTFKIKIDS